MKKKLKYIVAKAENGIKQKPGFFNQDSNDPNTTIIGGENSQGYFQQHPMNVNVANPLQTKNWNPNGGVNTNDLLTGSLAIVNGLIPNSPIQDNKKKLIDSYNPYSSGTGSHGSFKMGGKLKKKAQEGKKVSNLFETAKPEWMDSVMNANSDKPWVRDLYNPNTPMPFLQNHDEYVHPDRMDNYEDFGIPLGDRDKADYFIQNANELKRLLPPDVVKQRFPKKASNGTEITPEQRNNWNDFIQYSQQQPGYGSEVMNHNSEQGQNMLQRYNTMYPNKAINPNMVQSFQQDFQNIQNGNNNVFGAAGTRATKKIPGGVSKVDNYIGTKTSAQQYPTLEYEHQDYKGNVLASKNYGTDFATGAKENTGGHNFDDKPYTQPVQQRNTEKSIVTGENYKKPDNSGYIANRKKRESETMNGSKKYDNLYMEYGGNVPIGQDGLKVEDNNYEMLSPNTAMIKGNSHAEGGTDISYHGNEVEAEAGEPVSIGNDGSAIVWGNMHIPGSNMKFKHAAEKIAKEEKKISKTKDLATNLVKTSDPYEKYQSTRFNTGKVLQDAVSQKEKVVGETKDYLSGVQNSMLDLAKESGKDPKEISKMMKGKAKYGIRLVADGDKLDFSNKPSEEIRTEQQEMMKNPNFDKGLKEWNRIHPNMSKVGKAGKFDDALDPSINSRTNFMRNYLKPKEQGDLRPKPSKGNYLDTFNPTPTQTGEQIDRLQPSPYVSSQTSPDEAAGLELTPVPPINEVPHNNPEGIPESQIPGFTPKPELDKKKGKGIRNRLGITDILPELSTIFDQPEPVPSQQYNPQLYSPYQVSFDERVAENQGDFNASQKALSKNPAALGALNAQKYNMDNQIRGEEFKTNQGISNDITNKNIGTINQAKEINLKLADEQQVRQSQGKSNTKDDRFRAVESLSNKFAQRRRDNTTLGIEEARFHYNYNPKDGATYQGPGTVWNNDRIGIQNPYPSKVDTTKDYSYDADGNRIREVDRKMYGGKIASRKAPEPKKKKYFSKA